MKRKRSLYLYVGVVIFGITFAMSPANALVYNESVADNAGIFYGKLNLKNYIRSSDIKNNSIKSKSIRNGTITSKDIKNNSIGSKDIKDGTVKNSDLKDGAMVTAKIADDAVTSTKIADGTIVGGDLASDIAITTSSTIIANGGITTNDGDDLGTSGSRWSTIYADTLNYSSAITDANVGDTVINFGDGELDEMNIAANTSIQDADWSVSNAGDAAFNSVTQGGSTVIDIDDSGVVTSTMIADNSITNADVHDLAAIAGTKVDPNFGSQTIEATGDVAMGNGNDEIVIDGDDWGVTDAGAAFFKALEVNGSIDFSGASSINFGSVHISTGGDVTGGTLHADNGSSDTFNTDDACIITVEGGIITGIDCP